MDVGPGLAVGLFSAGAAGAWLWLRGKATHKELVYNIPVAKVSKLYVYPVKSCHRIEVDSVQCLKRGLRFDRTFVVIGKNGQFMSQRVHPTMALVQPRLDLSNEIDGPSMFLTAPGMEEVVVKIPQNGATPTENIRIWKFSGEGIYMGDEIGSWFSRYLGDEGCSVYYMSPSHKPRYLMDDPVWTDLTQPGDQTSFSDFAPLVLVSEASMELLNSKVEEKLEVERFRPNIILSGCLPHAEDYWKYVCVGNDLLLRKMKPVTRCKMTTVHQEKGEFSSVGEPLKTLQAYRHHSQVYEGTNDERYKLLFGCHYGVVHTGEVRVHDIVCTNLDED